MSVLLDCLISERGLPARSLVIATGTLRVGRWVEISLAVPMGLILTGSCPVPSALSRDELSDDPTEHMETGWTPARRGRAARGGVVRCRRGTGRAAAQRAADHGRRPGVQRPGVLRRGDRHPAPRRAGDARHPVPRLPGRADVRRDTGGVDRRDALPPDRPGADGAHDAVARGDAARGVRGGATGSTGSRAGRPTASTRRGCPRATTTGGTR